MTLKRISPDPLTGMESRTFECQRCGQSLTEVANSDVDPIATASHRPGYSRRSGEHYRLFPNFPHSRMH
jgi:hypothetical protein